VFKAFRIIALEKGKPRRRFLTQREAREFEPEPEGIYRPLSTPKPKRVPQYLAAKGTILRESRVTHPA
jgi:hypothetical protein